MVNMGPTKTDGKEWETRSDVREERRDDLNS